MKVQVIQEDVQLIKLDQNSVLTPVMISNILRRAYSNKMYAKFLLSRQNKTPLFIQVNYNRDGDISVSSNIRSPAFLNDFYKKSQIGWNINNVKAFVYQWLTISRRSLY